MAKTQLKGRLGSVQGWLRRFRVAIRSGLPDDWESTELAVQQKMRTPLGEHLRLVSDLDELASQILRRLQTPVRQPEAVIRAHFTLVARVLQDLRASTILVRSGYTMQAWSVAASSFEAAHTMGFIAVDADRATQWLEHNDTKTQFCSAKTGVQGSFKYLGLGRQGRERESLVEKEYSLYERLCMAKHVNPLAERNRYITKRKGGTTLTITPFYSERRAREARLGLLLASRAATLALWVFQQAHLPSSETDKRSLIMVATRTEALLDKWKDLDE